MGLVLDVVNRMQSRTSVQAGTGADAGVSGGMGSLASAMSKLADALNRNTDAVKSGGGTGLFGSKGFGGISGAGMASAAMAGAAAVMKGIEFTNAVVNGATDTSAANRMLRSSIGGIGAGLDAATGGYMGKLQNIGTFLNTGMSSEQYARAQIDMPIEAARQSQSSYAAMGLAEKSLNSKYKANRLEYAESLRQKGYNETLFNSSMAAFDSNQNDLRTAEFRQLGSARMGSMLGAQFGALGSVAQTSGEKLGVQREQALQGLALAKQANPSLYTQDVINSNLKNIEAQYQMGMLTSGKTVGVMSADEVGMGYGNRSLDQMQATVDKLVGPMDKLAASFEKYANSMQGQVMNASGIRLGK